MPFIKILFLLFLNVYLDHISQLPLQLGVAVKASSKQKTRSRGSRQVPQIHLEGSTGFFSHSDLLGWPASRTILETSLRCQHSSQCLPLNNCEESGSIQPPRLVLVYSVGEREITLYYHFTRPSLFFTAAYFTPKECRLFSSFLFVSRFPFMTEPVPDFLSIH